MQLTLDGRHMRRDAAFYLQFRFREIPPKRTREYRDLVERSRWLFRAALASGRIKKQPCVRCGSTKAEGHHEDYRYPLDVTWLCRVDHKARHKELTDATHPNAINETGYH